MEQTTYTVKGLMRLPIDTYLESNPPTNLTKPNSWDSQDMMNLTTLSTRGRSRHYAIIYLLVISDNYLNTNLHIIVLVDLEELFLRPFFIKNFIRHLPSEKLSLRTIIHVYAYLRHTS